MPATSTDNDQQLGHRLLMLIARLNRWSSRHVDTRLPLNQVRLLSWTEERQMARISDMAQAENCTQPAMTVQVRKLEERDLVQRSPDPSDARAVLISLTPHGRRLLAEVRAARAATIAPAIAALDDGRRDDLEQAVDTLTRLLDQTTQTTPEN